MVVEIHENTEDNDSDDDKPLEHVSNYYKHAGNSKQQYPADVEWAELIIVFVNIIQQRMCAAFVDVPGI